MSPFARKPSPAPPDKPRDSTATWTTKALNLSDKWGSKFNDYAADKWGLEAFWPTTGDFPREMEKAARILKGFTSESPAQMSRRWRRVGSEAEVEKGRERSRQRSRRRSRWGLRPQVVAMRL